MNKIVTLFGLYISEKNARKKSLVIFGFLVFDLILIYLSFLANLLFFPGVEFLKPVGTLELFLTNLDHILRTSLFLIMLNLLIEELVFRVPISFYIKSGLDLRFKLSLIFLSSIIFGIIHLQYFDTQELFITLPVMIIGGLIYSFVYLLLGGKDGKVLLPLVGVWIIHVLYDLLIFSLFIRT